MQHRPFVFLDIETTGGSPASSRVLEVGALRVERNQIVKTYRQLISPEESIPWFITKLTGITEQDVWEQPNFRAVADELEELLDGAIFVAHNVGFDYSFLQMEFARLGRKLEMDRFCTARLSRKLYPEHRRHNLDEIIRRQGYMVAERHRAFDDAEVLYKFYVDQLEKFGLDIYKTIDQVLVRSRPKPLDGGNTLELPVEI